jgi:hypothetical protein
VCLFELQFFGLGKGILCDAPAADLAVIDTACAAFEPITYGRADTPETVQQVRAHNAAWDALCKDQ